MTDRPMTPQLAAALDALTPIQRRTLAVIAGESEHGWISSLLHGLSAEVVRLQRREDGVKIREDMVLHAFEADRQADVDNLAAAATWHTEPEDRTKGVAWFPWAAPDTIEGLE